jgi:hypothetical protein
MEGSFGWTATALHRTFYRIYITFICLRQANAQGIRPLDSGPGYSLSFSHDITDFHLISPNYNLAPSIMTVDSLPQLYPFDIPQCVDESDSHRASLKKTYPGIQTTTRLSCNLHVRLSVTAFQSARCRAALDRRRALYNKRHGRSRI